MITRQGYSSFTNNDFDVIRRYLINRGRDEFAANLSPGYCRGLGLFFGYSAANKKSDQFITLLKAVGKWQEDDSMIQKVNAIKKTNEWQDANKKLYDWLLTNPAMKNMPMIDQVNEAKVNKMLNQVESSLLLSARIPEDKDIEKLLSIIEFLQRPQKYLENVDNAMSSLNIISNVEDNEFNDKSVFEAAIIIPKSNFKDVLSKLPIDHYIELGSGRHAVGLYRDNDFFYYYDSNFKADNIPKFHDVEELANHILENTYSEIIGTHIPLTIAIFNQKRQPLFDLEELNVCCEQYIQSVNADNIISNGESAYPYDGLTPLILAIIGEYHQAIKKLTEGKPDDLNRRDNLGFSAIHYAVFRGMNKVVQELIEKGANVDQVVKQHGVSKLQLISQSLYESLAGATPLHFAVISNDIEMAKFLLSNGANINAKTDVGLTPLAFAAIKGNSEMLEFLINQQADINCSVNITDDVRIKLVHKQDDSMLPLEFYGAFDLSDFENEFNVAMCAAACKQNKSVLNMLDRGLNINAAITIGVTLLHIAINTGNIELTQELLKRGANIHSLCHFSPTEKDSVTDALGIACLSNHLDIVNLLLNSGASCSSSETNTSKTPGMVIALENHYQSIVDALLKSDIEQRDLLETTVSLDRAALVACDSNDIFNVILSNKNVRNLGLAFDFAINDSHNDYQLLKKLASNNKIDVDEITLGQFKILFKNGQTEIVRQLFKNSINLFLPLKGDASRMTLIEIGIKDNFTGLYPIILESLNQKNINKVDINEKAIIHYAILNYQHDKLKDLLEMGADPNLSSNEVKPISMAMKNLNFEAMKLLLIHGADINLVLDDGMTLFAHLIKSSARNMNELVELFLQKGANIHDKVYDTCTVLEYVKAIGNNRLYEILKQFDNTDEKTSIFKIHSTLFEKSTANDDAEKQSPADTQVKKNEPPT